MRVNKEMMEKLKPIANHEMTLYNLVVEKEEVELHGIARDMMIDMLIMRYGTPENRREEA